MLEKEIPEQLNNMPWYGKKFVFDYHGWSGPSHAVNVHSLISEKVFCFCLVFVKHYH